MEAGLFLTPDKPTLSAMPQVVASEKSASSSKTVIAGSVAVATGAASVADQVDQITPLLNSVSTAGASLQSVMKLGAAGLSIIALAAGAYMLWRYIQKKRRGEVMST